MTSARFGRKERCCDHFVSGRVTRPKGEGYEAYAYSCNDGRACGLRDEAAATAGDADLRERHADPGRSALPAATAAAASAAAGHLPGRDDASGRLDLSGAAASAAASAPRRRTRLTNAREARVRRTRA